MSQDSNSLSQDQNNGQPKRFLKKGEGLKRFAAYKPPPPTTTTKTQRRQTFVRFKLDNKLKRDQHYIDPDILLDDSINLSTEIPKIAPPKIMHTPVRPNHRPALGTLNSQEFDLSTPLPGNCIIALGRQIQQIQETVNELKEKVKNCECGALMPQRRRPTTRSQAKAKSSSSSSTTTTTTLSDKTRPSADADNNNPAVKLLNCLNDKIDQLREDFEEMSLKK